MSITSYINKNYPVLFAVAALAAAGAAGYYLHSDLRSLQKGYHGLESRVAALEHKEASGKRRDDALARIAANTHQMRQFHGIISSLEDVARKDTTLLKIAREYRGLDEEFIADVGANSGNADHFRIFLMDNQSEDLKNRWYELFETEFSMWGKEILAYVGMLRVRIEGSVYSPQDKDEYMNMLLLIEQKLDHSLNRKRSAPGNFASTIDRFALLQQQLIILRDRLAE